MKYRYEYVVVSSVYKRIRSDLQTVSDDLNRDGKGWILLAVGTGWFISLGTRYMFPALIPYIREEFNLSLVVAGLIWTAISVSYALGQFPSGIIGDQIGEGRILAISTVLTGVSILIVATSVSAELLFIGVVLFGFSAAMFAPHRFTIFTEIYHKRSGTAVGITYAAGSIGNTVLPAIGTVVAGIVSWRLGFGILFPIFALVTLLIYTVVPSRVSSADDSRNPFSKHMFVDLKEAVLKHGIPVVVTIHIILSFVSTGFLGFYPTYLVDVKGHSPQVASVLYGIYFAFGVAIQPLTGMARDRFGPKKTLLFTTGLYFSGLVLLIFGSSIAYLILITTLISSRNGLGVITNTYIATTLPSQLKGPGLGLLRTSWLIIGGLSPIFIGYLGELGALENAYIVLALISGIAVVLTLLIPGDGIVK